MFPTTFNTGAIKTTSYKVVIPFYIYAAVSFFAATILLFTSSESFSVHFFNPHILAITHTMALGWATMIIFGASYQLVPVVAEGKLYSNKLAYISFGLAAVGIPLLVYGFFIFNMHAPAKWGGRFVLFAALFHVINIITSIAKGKSNNIHAKFVLAAALWLFVTVFLGLVLVYNFTISLLPHGYNYMDYLPLHGQMGIVGWFLLLVIGVGSRLIPMFLISKYTNTRLLWAIFILINTALITYIISFYTATQTRLNFIPITLIFTGVLLFIYYCFQAYKKRLRKQVDVQVKISLLSVLLLLIPIIVLTALIAVLLSNSSVNIHLTLTYGFVVFFGWLTAIILGMTFKTLPFIVWNKVYHHRASLGKTPSPKELFNANIFKVMTVCYLVGFVLFAVGILQSSILFLKMGAAFLIITAVSYNLNVLKVVYHKPKSK